MSRIDILLATYNGAEFLPEQLASLAAQTHADWRLLVRDDGSRDGSLDVVREWADGVEQPVEIIEDGRTGLGASLNFAALLEHSDAPYFACCDQDDVWLPEKLEVMLIALREVEEVRGSEAALLAFCDLEVVDRQLRPIASSFWNLSRMSMTAKALEPEQVMLRNPVTGCAMLGNRALLKLALPITQEARLHDWWLALTAGAKGRLIPVPCQLIKYRQHGSNAVGAQGSGTFSLVSRFVSGPAASIRRAMAARDNSQRQARAFASRFGDNADWQQVVAGYGNLAEQPALHRKWFLLRHGLGIGSPLYFLALLTVV